MENDRDTSLQSWEFLTRFLPRPADREQREVIDRLAEFVAVDGVELENAVRDREAKNPLFAFLRTKTAESTYYRWRVYARAMESASSSSSASAGRETRTARRTAPVLMQTDGAFFWVPPPENDSGTNADAADLRDAPREEAREDGPERTWAGNG